MVHASGKGLQRHANHDHHELANELEGFDEMVARVEREKQLARKVRLDLPSGGRDDATELRLPRWQDTGRLRGHGHAY